MESMLSDGGSSVIGGGDIVRNNVVKENSSLSGNNTDNSSRPSNHTSPVKKVELQRSITFIGVVAILIANIGGTGIFIAPNTILIFSGSPGLAMIMWLLGGIVQACLAFCVVELAMLFNKAGGPYYFINCTFGDLASFVFMWGYLIFLAAPSWALGAYTASLYSLSLIFRDCPPPEGLVKLIAAWIMITLIAMNCTYMKVITSIQKFLTMCKVFALILIIILGFVNIPTETGQDHIKHFMDGTTTNIGKMSLALFAGYFGFGGWPIITILAEEVKMPKKNIPRGLGFSFAVLIATVVTANFAYYTVLTKEESLKSDAVAMSFGQMIHPALPVVIAILVCLCSIGTLNVLILGHPRMIFAAGRNGHMPRIMTMLHKEFNSPWPATFTLGLLAIVMLMSGSVMSLVETVSLYAASMMLMLLLCLFTLRWKQPDVLRPIKVPLIVPIFLFILTATLVALSVIEMSKELGLVAFVVFLGVPVYYMCVKLQKPVKIFNYLDTLGFYLQVCLHLRYEDK